MCAVDLRFLPVVQHLLIIIIRNIAHFQLNEVIKNHISEDDDQGIVEQQ